MFATTITISFCICGSKVIQHLLKWKFALGDPSESLSIDDFCDSISHDSHRLASYTYDL